MTGNNKTVINNWTGGGTLQTWTDGEWQILYAKDSAGNVVTLSLTSQDAVRLAYAVSPIPQEQFDRMRDANAAVYELSYPEARADELRQIADEIECDGGCEGCGPQKQERGEFCGFVAADNLRKLAKALDLKAETKAALHSPKIAAAETSPGDVLAMKEACKRAVAEVVGARDDLGNVHYTEIAAAIDRLDVKAEAKSQEAEAVTIKPLEWREFHGLMFYGGDFYRIEDQGENWSHDRFWLYVLGTREGKFRTLDEAKAAAQADFEHRIRSALIHPTTKPEAPAWRDIQSAIEQAIDCIRGETPEDCSDEEARADTLSKLRDAEAARAFTNAAKEKT